MISFHHIVYFPSCSAPFSLYGRETRQLSKIFLLFKNFTNVGMSALVQRRSLNVSIFNLDYLYFNSLRITKLVSSNLFARYLCIFITSYPFFSKKVLAVKLTSDVIYITLYCLAIRSISKRSCVAIPLC